MHVQHSPSLKMTILWSNHNMRERPHDNCYWVVPGQAGEGGDSYTDDIKALLLGTCSVNIIIWLFPSWHNE